MSITNAITEPKTERAVYMQAIGCIAGGFAIGFATNFDAGVFSFGALWFLSSAISLGCQAAVRTIASAVRGAP